MIVYYSGSAGFNRNGPWAEPEVILGDHANLMLSYGLITKKHQTQHIRWPKLLEARGMKEKAPEPREPFQDLVTGCVESHFLDSGSFSLWTQVAGQYAKEKGVTRTDPFAYYKTKKFLRYLDSYAEFIKTYRKGIDLYANVDVIPNPELSWISQQYLEEEHELVPVPVVHYKTDLGWLRHYIELGYDLIALGGLVGSISQPACRDWIDRCFELVCNTKDHKPCVKIHGFGVNAYDIIRRYPWWSVDSTSWTKAGAFGGIYVPKTEGASGSTGGKFTFDKMPYLIKVSDESPNKTKHAQHFYTLREDRQKLAIRWLKKIGIPLGAFDKKGNIVEYGVITRHIERRAANLLFFERMRKTLPEWPWAWKPCRRPSFGVRFK